MALPPLSMAAIGGRVFSYRETGEGPALVLLHALGGSSAIWEPQFEPFAASHRVIAWDAPGYGSSDYLAGSPSAADYAEALAAFLDAIELERAHLVGHGMGARVAAAFGRLYPERVASVTLVAGAAEVDEPRAAAAPGARDDVVAKLNASFAMVPFLARKQALAMVAKDELAADMAEIEAPLHAIDRVANAGHFGALENPEAFNAALGRFLAGLGAKRKARARSKPKKAKGSGNGNRPGRKRRAGDRRQPRNRKSDGRRAGATRGKRRNRRA